ncbi:TetR/AcrR family transcriptional regulator [Streptomyces sp. NPDC087420]|uniref:TetR/AcrR family transcriptional regulator n=1 Tax=Streptomyces sp. NPDC087420 TaxID=3365785 RepID=UPI003835DF39
MTSLPHASGRRADAQHNIDAILDAAVENFALRPNATLAEIAKAAGVGRVTLYGHFASRAELVNAAMTRVLEQGDAVLEPLELDGDPAEALERLIGASWRLIHQSRSLLAAAQKELSSARIRDLHAGPAARAERLLARGQSEGVFRSDLPASWLVATLHNVLHGAADEINAGRLKPEDAARTVSLTLLAAFAA